MSMSMRLKCARSWQHTFAKRFNGSKPIISMNAKASIARLGDRSYIGVVQLQFFAQKHSTTVQNTAQFTHFRMPRKENKIIQFCVIRASVAPPKYRESIVSVGKVHALMPISAIFRLITQLCGVISEFTVFWAGKCWCCHENRKTVTFSGKAVVFVIKDFWLICGYTTNASQR